MPGFFKRFFGKAESPPTEPLFFRDGHAAFEFSCFSLKSELLKGNVIPALVLDAVVELGAESSVVRMPNGTQMLALRVSSSDGGFLVLAGTLSARGPILKPGDLVAWSAGEPIPRETFELTKDPRSSWVGIVLAKLRPEYKSGHGWAIAEPFLQ